MCNFLTLFFIGKLAVGFNMSFITQVEKLVGFPLTAVVLNPTIEYAYVDRFGISMDNLYASADCVDSSQNLEAHIGLNCAMITPFYRYTINNFAIDGCVGMLRVDAAGLASVDLDQISYAGLIDTTQMGFYGAIRGAFTPTDMIKTKLLVGTAFLKGGSFNEISASLTFKPFIRKASADSEKKENLNDILNWQRNLFLTMNFTFANIKVAIDEENSFSPTLIIYLFGVGYEF